MEIYEPIGFVFKGNQSRPDEQRNPVHYIRLSRYREPHGYLTFISKLSQDL